MLVCGPSNQSVTVVLQTFSSPEDSNRDYLRIFSANSEREDISRLWEVRKKKMVEEKGKKKPKTERIHPREIGNRIEDLPIPPSFGSDKVSYLRSLHIQVRLKCPEIEELEADLYYLKAIEKKRALTEGEQRKREMCEADLVPLIHKQSLACVKEAMVIFCTLTVSGSIRFRNLFDEFAFPQVLIDECSQAGYAEAVMALLWAKERVVLLGDHKQLAPVVLSQVPRVKEKLETSLMARYFSTQNAVMLCKQFRMHESIVEFPNRQFYKSKLETSADTVDLLRNGSRSCCPQIWKDDVRVVFRNTHIPGGGEKSIRPGLENIELSEEELESLDENSSSFTNVTEAEAILKDIAILRSRHLSIAVITPYAGQRSLIQTLLQKRGLDKLGIKCLSIHSCQGSEADCVLFSTVRCVADVEDVLGLGHLDDDRLLNVALTRAKYGLIVYGCVETLTQFGGRECARLDYMKYLKKLRNISR